MSSSENKLQYSEDALSVKALFYNKKWMVYVEGPDDVPFWDYYFLKISKDFQVQEVNGYNNLIPYMDSILNNTNDKIVACDKDHSCYLDNNKYVHNCIITTYGYSIENTMYCNCNINSAIKKLARTTTDFNSEIDNWYKDFCSKSLQILPYDIINYITKGSDSCYGDNCCRFLISNNSENLDATKITTHITTISSNVNQCDIDNVNSKITNDNREDRFKIKGHFLSNGVSNFIKNTVQKVNRTVVLSNDAIFALMVNCSKECNPECADKQFILSQIKNAMKTLNS
jgi:hypothetical protein